MKIILILVCILLKMSEVQAQTKEPVQPLQHGLIHRLVHSGAEVRVEVHLIKSGQCQVGVNGSGIWGITKGSKVAIYPSSPPMEVRCNSDSGQLFLLKNTLPPGWEYAGFIPIPRRAQ